MENDQLTQNQKLKMMNFAQYVTSGNQMRYNYISMLQKDYKDLLNQEKQQIKCQHCNQIVIGKAYGPHVKKVHPDTVKNKRNRLTL